MKKIVVLIIIALFTSQSLSQVWVFGGHKRDTFEGVYLTSYSHEAHPGGRWQHDTTKHKDTIYLFGGRQYDRNSSNFPFTWYVEEKNDLWIYNCTLDMWKWIDTFGDGNTLREGDELPSEWGTSFSSSNYPGSRFGAGMATVGDFVYLWGGSTWRQAGDDPCDLWEFSTSLKQWRWINTRTVGTVLQGFDVPSSYGSGYNVLYYPGSRWSFPMISYGTYLFLFGGETTAGRKGDMWQYDTATELWQFWETNAEQTGEDFYSDFIGPVQYPGSRKGSSMWAYNGFIYLLFGYGRDETSTLLFYNREFWAFDINEVDPLYKWEFKAHTPWSKTQYDSTYSYGIFEKKFSSYNLLYPGTRTDASWALHDSLPILYIFGGWAYSKMVFGSTGDLWQFNFLDEEFISLSTFPAQTTLASYHSNFNPQSLHPGGRTANSLQYHDGKIYLYGGYNLRQTMFASEEE